ncbi:MAG: hypothetical protein LBQ62_04695 [Candidatus Accumulibacter sp.]|jgi:hypothetical protein|nr:hypothetical protein [Accumulibacter sp.]
MPLAQMPAAVEHAGTFIGIRNGLRDVLFTANCRKTVVFPNGHYSTTPHNVAEFFALPGWESIVYEDRQPFVRDQEIVGDRARLNL